MNIRFTVGGRRLKLTKDQVVRAMSGVEPETINKHLVEMNDTVFPPKQVLATVTGWERQSFTTQEAQRVLKRLGFVCRRADETDTGTAWVSSRVEDDAQRSLGDRTAKLEAAIGTIQAAISGLHERMKKLENS